MLDDFGNRRVQAIEEVSKLEPVLLHRLLMPALDNRKTRARQHARVLTPKRLIHRSKLREIGNLGRASDVRGSRQQVVLNDRPERHVRAKATRTAPRKFNKLFAGERAIRPLHSEAAILLGKR